MKHTLRCHDFGKASFMMSRGADPGRFWWKGCGEALAKIVPARKGLRPESPARRSVEQGSAQRGAGTRLRDATVKPIEGASFQCRSHARLGGQIPGGAPSSAPRRAPLAGMRPRRRAEDRGIGALMARSGVASKHTTPGTCSALRGTLCRSACQYRHIVAAPRFALSTILATTHARFIMLRALSD
jgi:hypothetical protein